MFVGEERRLDVSFTVARERLARLCGRDALLKPSEDAYDHGTEGLARVGVRGASKLVRVQVRELARAGQAAGVALRWEAAGTGGTLFPVLDADLTLTPDGDDGSLLRMAGAYRPPLGRLGGALDRAVLHRVAAATIRGFVADVAAQLSGHSAPGAAGYSPPPRSPSPCPPSPYPPSPEVKA